MRQIYIRGMFYITIQKLSFQGIVLLFITTASASISVVLSLANKKVPLTKNKKAITISLLQATVPGKNSVRNTKVRIEALEDISHMADIVFYFQTFSIFFAGKTIIPILKHKIPHKILSYPYNISQLVQF